MVIENGVKNISVAQLLSNYILSLTHRTFSYFVHISIVCGSMFFTVCHLEFDKEFISDCFRRENSGFGEGRGVDFFCDFRELRFCGPCGPCFLKNIYVHCVLPMRLIESQLFHIFFLRHLLIMICCAYSRLPVYAMQPSNKKNSFLDPKFQDLYMKMINFCYKLIIIL